MLRLLPAGGGGRGVPGSLPNVAIATFVWLCVCGMKALAQRASSSDGRAAVPWSSYAPECCPCDFLLPFSGFWHRQQTLKKMNSFLTAAGAARARQRSGCDASHRSREGAGKVPDLS